MGSWVRLQPPNLFDDIDREILHQFFEKYLPELYINFFNHSKLKKLTNEITITTSFLRLLEIMLTRAIIIDENLLENVVVFCIIWGFGSKLGTSEDGIDCRKIFDSIFRDTCNTKNIIPSSHTVFDYRLNTKSNRFESWELSSAVVLPPSTSTATSLYTTNGHNMKNSSLADIFVSTFESRSLTFWADPLIEKGTNVMLTGAIQVIASIELFIACSCYYLSTPPYHLILSCPVLSTYLPIFISIHPPAYHGVPPIPWLGTHALWISFLSLSSPVYI